MPAVKALNWIVMVVMLAGGAGMGGWASLKTLTEKIDEFHYFARFVPVRNQLVHGSRFDLDVHRCSSC